MATNSKGNNETKTISIEYAMFSASETRRKNLRFRSYSAYIQRLIERDLETGGDLLIRTGDLDRADALNDATFRPPTRKARTVSCNKNTRNK